MTEKWLDDIQSSMANYETDEPAGLWDAIAQAEPAPRPRHRKTYRHYIAAACAAVAVAVGGFVFFNADYSVHTAGHRGTAPMTSNNGTSPIANDCGTKPGADAALPTAIATVLSNSDSHNAKGTSEKPAVLAADNSVQEQTVSTPDSKPNSKADATATAQKPAKTERPAKPAQPYYYYDTPLPMAHKRQTGRMSLALYTGGTGNASSSARLQNTMLMAAAPSSDCAAASDPRLGYVMSNAGEDVVKEVKHRMPMRFGLNAAFHLTDRLALETGLTYTQLNSDMREGSDRSYYEGTQRLHYVGIPLNVKYNIYTVGGLNIYASAGTLVEQCVSGRKETSLIVNGQNAEHSEEAAGSNPTQLSFNAAAGVQYNFTPLVGIYAEPGLSYYVNDNSSLSTVYKEHPWNFNVNLGLRFNLK